MAASGNKKNRKNLEIYMILIIPGVRSFFSLSFSSLILALLDFQNIPFSNIVFTNIEQSTEFLKLF